MATFPPLAPSTRTYTPGEYPHTPFTSMSGEQTRVRHSTAVLNSRLELTYERLSQDDRQAIETHYHGQQGEFVAFTLSPQVFSGFVPLEVDPSGQWRYAEPPEVEDFCGPTANVKVVMVSVPGAAPGAQAGPVAVSIVAGQSVNVLAGATRTITVSFTAGAATATNPAGPVLLLHMEGTGTTIVDSSSSPKTITLGTGDVQDITQSTTQKKFGSKSLYFPSGWSYMEASGLGLSSGSAFTLELFFWLSSAAASSGTTFICRTGMSLTNTNYNSDDGLKIGSSTAIGSLATETWHYIKITRNTSNVIRRFLNGTEYYTGSTYTDSGTLGTLTLGTDNVFDDSISMKGYIDEVRIRPEADNSLTVPTAAFPDP